MCAPSRWLAAIAVVMGVVTLALVTSAEGSRASDEDGAADPTVAHACPVERVPDGGFTDTAGNTHEAAIDCIVWYDVTHGVGGQRYAPAGTVTRDQMASFAARAVGHATVLPSPSLQGFTDIAGNAHEARILQLADVGVVHGTAPGTYSPRLAVSRAQMATILVRTFEHAGGSLPAPDDHFGDDAGNPHEGNINKAAEAGFTSGTSASSFSPSASVRRDQMASFVARMLDKLVVDGHMTADPVPQPDPAPPPRSSDDTQPSDFEGVVVTLAVEWQPESELSDAERHEQRARVEAAQDQLLEDLGSHGRLHRRLTATAQLAVGVDEQGRRLLEQHELVAAVQDDTAEEPAPAS